MWKNACREFLMRSREIEREKFAPQIAGEQLWPLVDTSVYLQYVEAHGETNRMAEGRVGGGKGEADRGSGAGKD